MVNALKKKMLGFAVVTVLAAALMVGCGNKSKNNSATSPSSGNGATDMPNETEPIMLQMMREMPWMML